MKHRLLFLGLVSATLLSAPVVFAGHGHHGEKMFEKMDADGNGVITKDEFMAKAEKRFAKMDADGNGEVTKEEAKAHHQEMKQKWGQMKERRDATGE